MPGGDRTGPEGRGPMTGRAFGYCAEYNSPGFTRGFPRGRRYRRGFRHRRFWQREYSNVPYDQPTVEEKVYLENLIKSLEDELKVLKDKVQGLSKDKKE